MSKVIAVIPARGGSQRIPRKNIKLFDGAPIIAYSIWKAKECGLFDEIIVTTDDDEMITIALECGATSVWLRDPELGKDEVGTQAVVAECLKGTGHTDRDTIACCIYATAPLMSVKDLTAGYDVLTNAPFCSYVFSVGYPNLRDAGQFYWGKAYDFVRNVPLVNIHTHLIHVRDERVCDINTQEDWDRALEMYYALRD